MIVSFHIPSYPTSQLLQCMSLETARPWQLLRQRKITKAWVPGVKQPEREADHSPPSSAKVKNDWSYTSTPPRRLHGVVHI